MNVTGALAVTGLVNIDELTNASQSIMTVGGAAPDTLTGTIFLTGNTGGAVLNYEGGGGITQIAGAVVLLGSDAFIETSGVSGNSALTGLTSITDNGTLAVRAGATVSTTGSLTNSANLFVGTGGTGDSIESLLRIGGDLRNTGTLEIGYGSLSVTGTFDNTGGTLRMNFDNTIGSQSLMTVGGAAPSTLVGAIEMPANGGSAVLNYQGGGRIIQIGDGSTNSGSLLLDGSNAFIEVGGASGNSALTGLQTITSNGDLELQDGAAVTASGNLANNGSLKIGNAVGGLVISAVESALANGGNPNPGDGSTLNVGGNLTNRGVILLGNGVPSSLVAANGTLNVAGTFDNTGGILQINGGNTVCAESYSYSCEGGGEVLPLYAALPSVMNVAGAAPSTLTGTFQLLGDRGAELNYGLGGAVLNFGSGGIVQIGDGSTNSGSLTIDGSNAFIEAGGVAGNSALTGLANVASNGTLQLLDGAVVSVTGNLVNAGTVLVNGTLNTNVYVQGPGTTTIGSGGTLTATTSYTQGSGTTDVNGTLMSPTVDINGGTLSGTGKIQGTVTVASGAALSPGDPGTVDILGPLDLAGTLNETIDSGSSFDVTDVSGQLTLDSSSVLDILLASGFDPSVGTSFAIMDAGSLATGSEFGSILNQIFNGGTEQWDIAYNSTDIVLTADTVTSSSSTPEPASFLLLGTGLLGLAWVARRKRARGAAR